MSKKIGTSSIPLTFERMAGGWEAFADLDYIRRHVMPPEAGTVNFVYVDHSVDEHRHLIRTVFEVHRA